MKDKEKQIEEIAREIAKRDCHLFDNCPKLSKHACISQNPTIMMESTKNYITIATWLVKLGYRKINKDSVVLSREEWNKLMGDTYTSKELDQIIAYKERAKAREVSKNILTKLAEDFSGLDGMEVEYPLNKVKNLAKQFGVEIKE